jgi:cell division protein FtsW
MRQPTKNMLLLLFFLITFGLIQVYTSSFIFAVDKYGDGLIFFKKQLLFVALGLAVLFVTFKMPQKILLQWAWLLWPLAVVALLLTFIPGLGVKVGGAQRWLPLGFGIRFEPSELIKIALPLMCAKFVTQSDQQWGQWTWPLRALIILGPMVLLLLQPDFGSFTICSMVLLSLIFVCGLRWRYILTTLALAAPTFYFLVMNVPYRKARVLAFLDPFKNAETSGFQLIQSMISFHSGGLSGVGLGAGQGKLFFLPAAHTDFTLAVLGEELGFIGFSLLLASYGFLVWRAFQLSFSLRLLERQVIALGLTLTFAFTVFVNVGVTLGLLPTKGLTLPFLSYGGSSLVMNCFLFGVLLNLMDNLHRQKAPIASPKGVRSKKAFVSYKRQTRLT